MERVRWRERAIGAAVAACCLTYSGASASASPGRDVFLGSALSANAAELAQPGGDLWWSQFLTSCKDLGPSRARQVSVVMDMVAGGASSKLESWARRHALQLQWYVNELVAVLSGSPARLGSALGVRVDDFISPDGQRFYSAKVQPGVPAALAGEVAAVGRLSNYKDYSTAYVARGGLSPQALLSAYDAAPLRAQGLNGAGETVVAFEIDGYSMTDLSKFTSKFKLPPFSAADGFSEVGGEAGAPAGETDMDLETVREIAPGAKIVYYNTLQFASGSASFTDILVKAFSDVAHRYPGAIWTLSIGACEKGFTYADLNAEDQAAVAAENTGTTIFAASGDTAGLECVNQQDWGSVPTQNDVGVWAPAVLPAVTGVGGTTLSVTSAGAYTGESAWFYPVLGQGTGGGTSTIFAQPQWQVGPGLPTPSRSVPRLVPDVAAVGDPLTGNAIYNGGSLTQGGGTSLATPIWAGFMALIDEYLHRNGGKPVGFLNPALYYLAGHSPTYPPFHDVTAGGNNIWRNGSGYNESTGLGSPDVYNLARDLLALERGR